MRVAACTVMALLAAGTSTIAGDSAVTMFVTVLAPASGPITQLTAKDFTIAGGKARVTDAVAATQPLSIELLVDVSRQTAFASSPIDDLHAALGTFVHTIRIGDHDAQIALMSVGTAATPVASFEAPADALDQAINTIAPGPEMSAVLIEAVDDACQALAKHPAPRRAVVSVDFATTDPIPGTAVKAMAKDFFESGATVWAVSVRGNAQQPYIRENTLNVIVKNNGGERSTIVTSTGLKDQLQMVANSLLSQYVLTIDGTDPQHVQQLKISTSGGAKVQQTVFVR